MVQRGSNEDHLPVEEIFVFTRSHDLRQLKLTVEVLIQVFEMF